MNTFSCCNKLELFQHTDTRVYVQFSVHYRGGLRFIALEDKVPIANEKNCFLVFSSEMNQPFKTVFYIQSPIPAPLSGKPETTSMQKLSSTTHGAYMRNRVWCQIPLLCSFCVLSSFLAPLHPISCVLKYIYLILFKIFMCLQTDLELL